MSNSIGKKDLWKFINQRINRIINSYHVYGIICILFDEIAKDLREGKEIKINNFGKIYLRQNKPKTYFNIFFQKKMFASGNKILRFKLVSEFRKALCTQIDMDKTFKK